MLDESGNELTMFEEGAWQLTNVFGNGELLATYDTKGLHFHVKDALGTRRVQTNDAGLPVEECGNLPFGYQVCGLVPNPPSTADDATPLHFTGKEHDTETGNDYFGARYYGSNIGRFISPDPSGLVYANPGNPQSFNLYSYVRNNPLRFIDPSGLQLQISCYDPPTTSWTSIDGVEHISSAPLDCEFSDEGLANPNIFLLTPISPFDLSRMIAASQVGLASNNKLPKCPPGTTPGSVVYKYEVPPASPQIYNFMLCVSGCMGGSPFRATSTSDSHPPNDPHSRGQAVDGTIPGPPSDVMQCGLNCGAMYEQNEYLHPSANATAGHYHFQLVPGRHGALGPGKATCHYLLGARI